MQPKRGQVPDRAAQPLCESLETRLLMAASIRHGVLRVTGTAASDDISISVTRSKIFLTLNATSQTFKTATVRAARVDGGLGDDWIGISGKLSAILVGGAGDDTLSGSSAADF